MQKSGLDFRNETLKIMDEEAERCTNVSFCFAAASQVSVRVIQAELQQLVRVCQNLHCGLILLRMVLNT